MSNPNTDRFKQDNPSDQLVVVLNSMEGNLLNAEDGLVNSEHFIKRMRAVLEDLKLLASHMSKNKW